MGVVADGTTLRYAEDFAQALDMIAEANPQTTQASAS